MLTYRFREAGISCWDRFRDASRVAGGTRLATNQTRRIELAPPDNWWRVVRSLANSDFRTPTELHAQSGL